MKKILLAVLGALMLAPAVSAAEKDFWGRTEWQILSDRERTAYLRGLTDGLDTMALFPQYYAFLPIGTTVADVRTYLSGFYGDVVNERIDVPAALMLLWMEQSGYPQAEIKEKASWFRMHGSSAVFQVYAQEAKKLAQEKQLQKPLDVSDFPTQ